MKNIIPLENITSKIYLIRGHKVLLDRDLAELYGVETRTLKQAVRRNIKCFPDDFMFELSREEGAFEISFICLYRTGSGHALKRP